MQQITPLSVKDLVDEFKSGKIAVPEIQRDIVWGHEKIKALLDSVLKGYPCSSIILWEPSKKDAEIMEDLIRPERLAYHKDNPPKFLLLDGQQRITALTSMIAERSILKNLLFEVEEDMPFIYVNLKKIPQKNDKKPLSKDVFEASTDKDYGKFPLVLINNLFDNANSIWTDPNYSNMSKEEKDNIREFTSRLNSYFFPIQIVSDVSYEEVGEIFLRINSQGTQLTGAEIYLAKIVPRWRGITKEFRSYTKNIKNKYNFYIDINLLMKLVTAIQCDVPNIKKLAEGVQAKSITRKDLNKAWKDVQIATEKIISLLYKDFFLDKDKYVTSKNSLVPLVYYVHLLKNKTLSGRDRRYIKNFFIFSQLCSHYGQQTETTLRKDLKMVNEDKTNPRSGFSELQKEIARETRSEAGYRGLNIKPADVTGIQSKNVLLLLMYIAMRKRGATNFGLDNPEQLNEISSDDMHLHHIFPFNFMKEKKFAEKFQDKNGLSGYEYRELVNDIANLTFISKEKNSSIGDLPPEQYLKNETKKENRKAHFIPENRELWNQNKFKEFLEERRKLIAKDLNRIINSIK